MVRKLSLAIAIALGVSPLSAYALGLGDIHSKSALNQYFNADIELLSLGEEDLADIRVNLAPREAFEKAGMERPFYLSRLKFKPMRLPDGSGVIRVTSREPVREPFLNFLVEVDWPRGHLLREYTVLLDPPVTLKRKAPVIQSPQARLAPAAAVTKQTAAPVAVGGRDAGGEGAARPGEYGPIRRNETLWSIAKKVRYRGATMEQTMISLFRANPNAFIGNNINSLKVGEILRVPGPEEVQALSPREARTAFREQANDRGRPKRKAPAAAPAAESEMATAAPAPAAAAPAVVPDAELKIATARPVAGGAPGSEAGEGAEKTVAQLEDDLIAAQEARESALEEGRELKSRIENLESQLQDLQRLVSLKDEQLARLQVAMAGKEQAAPAEPEMVADELASPVVEGPPSAEAEMDEASIEGDELAGLEELAGDEAIQPDDELSGLEVEAEQKQPEAAPEAPAVAAPEKQAAPVSTPMGAPTRKPDLLQQLMSDSRVLIGAAAGVVLLLLALIWTVIRRRKSSSADFQESILIDTIDEEEIDAEQAVVAEEPVSHDTEETSFLSDFTPEDIEAAPDETGEVDPLAEADVYIAYGRYKQAEELIRQAMEREPQRFDLKQKLFEILSSSGNVAGFEALAEQARAEGMKERDPAGWRRVAALGATLSPNNPMFKVDAGAAPSKDEDEVDFSTLEEELGSIDLDLSDQAEEDVEGTKAGGEGTVALSADAFDLHGPAAGKATDSDIVPDEPDLELEQGLDFDLDLGGKDAGAVAGSKQVAGGSGDEGLLDLSGLDVDDLDLDIFEDSSGISLDDLSDENVPEPVLEDEVEINLPDVAAEAGENGGGVYVLDEEALADTVIDFSGTATEPAAESVSAAAEADQAEVLPLSLDELDVEAGDESLALADEGYDEVNTKIDLARAYVEMADADGARSILEEVLQEGNEMQREEARQIMQGLG